MELRGQFYPDDLEIRTGERVLALPDGSPFSALVERCTGNIVAFPLVAAR